MDEQRKPEQFDVMGLRRKVAELRARTDETPGETTLNPFARQIAEQYRDTNFSPTMLVGLIGLFEFAVMFLTGALVQLEVGATGTFWPRVIVVFFGSALTVLILHLADAYQIPALRGATANAGRVLGSWAVGFVLMMLALAVPRGEPISAVTAIVWLIATGIVLFAERQAIAFAIRHWARNGVMERRAVIVGGGEPAKQLIRELERQPDNDIRVCGIFDDRGSDRSPTVVAGYPKLGTFGELVEFARLARIDMLIIALPASAEQRILQLLRKLWVLPVDIRLAAHANRLRFRPRSYSHVGEVPMFDIFDKPIRDWDSVAKRAFDIAFTLVSLAVLWPIMIGAAIAVKMTSSGPILFKQKRHGFNNEIIEVLKFRSMFTNMADQSAIRAVTKGDPRVTPVGRFLRKSSIDELPQLFNVLKGQLSLVGPRPHAISAQTGERKYVDVVESYFARHRVKPGVTGWAQINGLRGELDSDEKIQARTRYDLDYIENWSLFFDLKILFLTPVRLLNTDNAY